MKVPGVMLMLVAPLTFQLSMLLAPGPMLAGLATNELIVGRPAAVTVIVVVLVAEPAEFVAVSVYVVVEAGVTVVDPFTEADVNPPGLMLILVALLVLQLSRLSAPAPMLSGFPPKVPIVGRAAVFCDVVF